MVALLLDNNIYGLTKKQTSPTTPQGYKSNTQPRGSYLPALNPLEATLGVTNASFVAQTAEWVPAHLFATLKAAYAHGASPSCGSCSGARTSRRTSSSDAVKDPAAIEILDPRRGHPGRRGWRRSTRTSVRHDPADIDAARRLAEDGDGDPTGPLLPGRSRPALRGDPALPKHTAEEKMDAPERGASTAMPSDTSPTARRLGALALEALAPGGPFRSARRRGRGGDPHASWPHETAG